MKFPCSGVILAGGQNKRFAGKNKALCRINGQRIIDRIYLIFKAIFNEIILVTNNPIEYLDWDVTIASDIVPVHSSLAGIHTGLFYTTAPYVFISACDTPFLKKELVECIIEHIDPNFDAIIPETSAGLEPLCAAYSRECVNMMRQKLLENKLKIQRIFNKNRIKKIPEPILRKKDKDLISFFNINSPEDLAIAQKMIEASH
ncbi:MAG: molybdenum cofactor guanylyltransferase [Deltaproteobacteria bacterium]|nr:molybdenum cofactor guanylyltransferase [Deltaproteobacteria bacterium]